jgi:hypothetical protein
VPVLSRVLAQWRESNAVVQSEAAELERLEEFRDTLGLFGDESSSCRRVLSWSKIADTLGGSVGVVWLFFDIALDGVVGRHRERLRGGDAFVRE